MKAEYITRSLFYKIVSPIERLRKAIERGDIVAGNAVLTVLETERDGGPGNKVKVYSCKVSITKQ